mgnify:CR=1 FL=1
MIFFDPKEEVIDIEITQHGKYLMSQGTFKPTYYQFFDDDILYDIAHVSGSSSTRDSELQNNSEPRIQEETPRLKPQHIYAGVESAMKKTQMGQAPVQPTIEKKYALSGPMGLSSLESNYAPAIRSRFWAGHISSSFDYMKLDYKSPNGTLNSRFINIPQLNANILYKLTATTEESPSSPKFIDDEKIYQPGDEYKKEYTPTLKDYTTVEFPDETFLHVEHDHLLIEMGEKNTPFLRDNFDIEVFEIEDIYDGNGAKTGEQRLKQLYFASKYPEYSDELLLEDDYMTYPSVDFSSLDSNYVEYFFNVEVDEEIDDEVFCRHRPVDKSENVFVDRTFDCPDVEATTQTSIYGPPDTEDGDICED